jgi:hypothetical protein
MRRFTRTTTERKRKRTAPAQVVVTFSDILAVVRAFEHLSDSACRFVIESGGGRWEREP